MVNLIAQCLMAMFGFVLIVVIAFYIRWFTINRLLGLVGSSIMLIGIILYFLYGEINTVIVYVNAIGSLVVFLDIIWKRRKHFPALKRRFHMNDDR